MKLTPQDTQGHPIHAMSLHESMQVQTKSIDNTDSITWTITKVTGGWIYTCVRLHPNAIVSQFVPE